MASEQISLLSLLSLDSSWDESKEPQSKLDLENQVDRILGSRFI